MSSLNTDPPGHPVASGAATAPAAANPAAPRLYCAQWLAAATRAVHAEVQDQHSLGVQHGRHQRHAPKGLGQAYRVAAEALFGLHRWISQVRMSPYCNNLYAGKSSGHCNQHMMTFKEKQQREANGHNRTTQQ